MKCSNEELAYHVFCENCIDVRYSCGDWVAFNYAKSIGCIGAFYKLGIINLSQFSLFNEFLANAEKYAKRDIDKSRVDFQKGRMNVKPVFIRQYI